jgi:hypothetical protein
MLMLDAWCAPTAWTPAASAWRQHRALVAGESGSARIKAVTLNLAWKHNGCAYLVADSIQSSRLLLGRRRETTTLGEPSIAGGWLRDERAAKVVVLSKRVLASFRGDTESALCFLRALRARDASPDSFFGDVLRETFDRVRPSRDFGLHVARRSTHGVELWSFESAAPAGAKLIEDISGVRAPEEDLLSRVEITGSAADANETKLIQSMATVVSTFGSSPKWALAAMIGWLISWAHYQSTIHLGVGGHFVGVALTPTGTQWMANTRILLLPEGWDRSAVPGYSESEPPPPGVGPFVAGHIQVDIAVFENVPVAWTNSENELGLIAEPFIGAKSFDEWREKWTVSRLRRERARLRPRLWIFISMHQKNVVFVTPSPGAAPPIREVRRKHETALMLSGPVRERLFSVRPDRQGRISWIPELHPELATLG